MPHITVIFLQNQACCLYVHCLDACLAFMFLSSKGVHMKPSRKSILKLNIWTHFMHINKDHKIICPEELFVIYNEDHSFFFVLHSVTVTVHTHLVIWAGIFSFAELSQSMAETSPDRKRSRTTIHQQTRYLKCEFYDTEIHIMPRPPPGPPGFAMWKTSINYQHEPKLASSSCYGYLFKLRLERYWEQRK